MSKMVLEMDTIFEDFKAKIEKEFGETSSQDWSKLENILNDLLWENDANEKAVVE